MNRIVIVGPGAMGTLVGSLLSRSGREVILRDDNADRAAQRNADGIQVNDGGSSWRVRPRSVCTDDDIGPTEAIFICTKAYQTASTIPTLAHISGPDTTVVSLQNGIGNGEQLQAVAADRCVCASTALGAYLDDTGELHWTGHGTTQIAPFQKTPATHATVIGRLLTEAGCECEVLRDADSMLWGKLIINAAINPVTAIYGITNGDLLEHDEARELAFAAAREARAIADAKGITLPYDDVVAAVTHICQRTSSNRSSMLRDIECGRPTEIDAITGAIITQAKALNIAIPVNQSLFTKIAEKTA
jgi:2-dehydropantoate 2-reductase